MPGYTSFTNAVERHRWWSFALVCVAYLLVATHQIHLPGVYMDAVNPDYAVVKILNPRHADVPIWVMQGNALLGNRVPILVQVYHGSQQFWLGLPLFFVFGTTVIGLRLTHAVFATGVLAAVYFLLLRGRLRPWQAACACTALAIDSTFSYAFRSQSYITVAPMMWLMLSIGLLFPKEQRENRAPTWFLSGLFSGLSIAGYFIYSFYLPVLLVLVAASSRDGEAGPRMRLRRVGLWLAGIVIGGSPYLVGYFLAARASGGIAGFLAFFREQQAALTPFESTQPLRERIDYAWMMIEWIVTNIWHNALFFRQWIPVPARTTKILLLTAAPYLLWLYAEWRGNATRLQRVLIALPVSYVAGSMIFGSRLSGHHFVPLIAIFYASLAVGLANAFVGTQRVLPKALGFTSVLVLLAAINVAGQVMVSRLLAETRGVGLFSDAINRLADDLNARREKPLVFFPDWGLLLPIEFLTRGTVPLQSVENHDKALEALCEGRDVALGLLTENRAARRDEWQKRLDWEAPSVTSYRQADGTIVFDFVTFRANKDAGACGHRAKNGLMPGTNNPNGEK